MSAYRVHRENGVQRLLTVSGAFSRGVLVGFATPGPETPSNCPAQPLPWRGVAVRGVVRCHGQTPRMDRSDTERMYSRAVSPARIPRVDPPKTSRFQDPTPRPRSDPHPPPGWVSRPGSTPPRPARPGQSSPRPGRPPPPCAPPASGPGPPPGGLQPPRPRPRDATPHPPPAPPWGPYSGTLLSV